MGPFSPISSAKHKGESPFSFDPGDQRFFLGFLLGRLRRKLLRLQGDYNLNEGNWEELTAGIGLEMKTFPWEWKEFIL